MIKLLFCLSFVSHLLWAAPIEVDLDGGYYLETGVGGFRPPATSRVTYKLGNKILHYDGFIYQDGEKTDRQWSIQSPSVVEMYHKHQALSEQWNSEVVVNLNNAEPHVTVTDYPNQDIKVEITSSDWRRARTQGYVMSPGPNQVTFTHKGLEYRPDGKVYRDGQPTGESWGLPISNVPVKDTGFGQAIGDFFNGEGGQILATTYQTIVTFEKIHSEKEQWDRYIEQRREQARKQVDQVIGYNDSLAKDMAGFGEAIKKHHQKIGEELDHSVAQNAMDLNEDSMILNIEPYRPQDREFAHLKYLYSETRYQDLKERGQTAAQNKDFEALRQVIDLTVNSEFGLPQELAPFTAGQRILLPEKIDLSLGESPLADFNPQWDQSTHLGQVATRTANKLQSSWALHDGLKYSPTETALKHLAGYSLFRRGVELMPWSAQDSLLYFKLSSMIIDTGIGVGVGFYQSLQALIETMPEMIAGGANFLYQSATVEGYLESTYNQLIQSIPAIEQAMRKSMLESWDTLINGSPFERGKLLGGLGLEVAVGYVTGGTAQVAKNSLRGSQWYKKSSQATKQLFDSLRGVRRSSQWLDQQRMHFDKIEHWVDYVDSKTIDFHSPAHPNPGPLDNKFVTDSIRYDDRGLPLPGQRVAETFSGGTYMSYVTKKPIRLFRVYSGSSVRGSYLTDIPPGGPQQAIADLALHPAYKNQALKWAVIEVPSGTQVFEGHVAPQIGVKVLIEEAGQVKEIIGMGNLTGMGRQYYIDHSAVKNLKVLHYGDF